MSSLEASLRLDIAHYQASLAKARGEAVRFKERLKKDSAGMGGAMFGRLGNLLPAASVATAVVGLKSMLSSADDLADAAERLNEMPETLQRVGRVAEITSGVGIDGLVGNFLKLEKALGDVDNKGAAEALERYGVTASQLVAMPLDQKVLALSDAFTKARSEGTGFNDLTQLVGRSAGDLIPMLQLGREAISRMYADSSVMANEAVFAMAAMNDEIDTMIANSATAVKNWVALSLIRAKDAAIKWGTMGTHAPDTEGDMRGAADNKAEGQQKARDDAARSLEEARNHALEIKANQQRKSADGMQNAREAVLGELAILRQQVSGHTEKADALKMQLDILKEHREIMAKTGASEAEALRMARETVALKKQIADIKDKPADDGERKKKIMGFSRERQGTGADADARAQDRVEAGDAKRAASLARDFRGLDANNAKQELGLNTEWQFPRLDAGQRLQTNPKFDPNQFQDKESFRRGESFDAFQRPTNPLANKAAQNAAAEQGKPQPPDSSQHAQQILQKMDEILALIK